MTKKSTIYCTTVGNSFKRHFVNRIPFNFLGGDALQIWRKRPNGSDTISVMLITFITTTLLRRGLRRYKTAQAIPPFLLGRTQRGRALAVNDSDNIRIFHYPQILRNWRLERFLINKEEHGGGLRNDTINCRLAGIDAPEMGHFGMGKQPFADEAQSFLKELVLNKEVSFIPHKLDQYQRAVCSVTVRQSIMDFISSNILLPFIPSPIWSRSPRMTLWRSDGNVSLAMAHAGYATIYKDMGAEYGGIKELLIEAEGKALKAKRGMWVNGLKGYVSPSDHKNKA